MTSAQVNGIELWYEELGDGDPLVIVHGSWFDHEDWRLVADGLAKETLIRLPFSRACISDQKRTGRKLGLLVRESDCKSRFQTQFTQVRCG